MAALELDIDLLPGVAGLIADGDETVVEHDDDDGDDDQHAQGDQQRHCTLLSPKSADAGYLVPESREIS
jgi:hypothetical protein